MQIEGAVEIVLHLHGNRVARPEVRLQWPDVAARLLQGKPWQQSLAMVPALFSICADAQATASVRAMEAALQQPASSSVEWARELGMRMELLREHLWRVWMDWPVQLRLPTDQSSMKRVMGIARAWKRALQPGAMYAPRCQQVDVDHAALQRLIGELDTMLERGLFGLPVVQWLRMTDADSIEDWFRSSSTGVMALLRAVEEVGWAFDGVAEVPALPALSPEEIMQRFRHGQHEDGSAYETTPWTRQQGHPLVQGAIVRWGRGLMARLLATLVEVAETFLGLQAALQQGICEASGVSGRVGDWAVSAVEAARGRLMHGMVIADGRTAKYRIFAPTVWNFHAQGCVACILKGLGAASREELVRKAGLLVQAIDPCVQFRFRVVADA